MEEEKRELECAGRGDGSDCPHGDVLIGVAVAVYRCDDCLHYWELDETEPHRRADPSEAPSLPWRDPDEAGHGTAA
ncbi:hypothetical protein [Streptomyces edwardsiae]|uniref:Uncharacterized protein n=1 Tax=Streptomyces edwardsiae TaxID=3075527 RepID=A0ABU2QPD5_9ACTN|nr:hypothetical protein [Streptomyces sp. DSM 41635]MDT0405089.1 hypothetical protein [Streptomyces sp. DSM 41635]